MTTFDDEALKAFADRPWGEVERLGRRYWQECALSPTEAIRLAEGLRHHVKTVRPDWPSEADRRDDRRAHTHLAYLFLQASGSGDQQ